MKDLALKVVGLAVDVHADKHSGRRLIVGVLYIVIQL